MGYSHQVIVYDIGEVVGRHTVAFEQYLIVEHLVFDSDLAEYEVVERACARAVDLLSYHIRFSRVYPALGLGGGTVAAVAGAALRHRSGFALRRFVLFLLVAEAVVGRPGSDELFRVLGVDALALALDIRTVFSARVRTFVVVETGAFECGVDHGHRVPDQPGAVGILDPEDEFAAG